MIGWRFALAAVLAAAAVAGCITHFSAPSPQVEADQKPPPVPLDFSTLNREASKSIAQLPSAKEKSVEVFEKAVDAILRREAYAGAVADVLPIKGRVPLPKRRPISRQ